MSASDSLIKILDAIAEGTGRFAAVFAPLMVLMTCYIVLTRYVFDSGSVPVQESVIYLNSLLFLLGTAYTHKHDAHVRVDIFYSAMGPRGKAWINIFGTMLLMMPVSAFILWICWDYVAASWAIREASPETGGLPFIWLLKALIPVMAITLLLQGVAEIVRNLRILTGHTLAVRAADADEEAAI